MVSIETIAFNTGMAVYGVLSIMLPLRLAPVWFYKTGTACILVLHGIFIGMRWYSIGHPPILGTFEETLAASWALTFISLIFDNKRRLAFIVIPLAFLTLLYGLNFDNTERPLIISEQSYWVYFHALFAWIAYGFYTLCAGASLCALLKKRIKFFSADNDFVEMLLHNGLLLGFTAQTVMFVLGAYYSSRLHGNWWIWDPVNYLFVVSWFLFAAAMHGRLFFAWKQEKVALWILLGFAGTLALYWGLIYVPWSTYHIFDPEIKIHQVSHPG